MKRTFLLLVLFSISFVGVAQLKLDVIKDGLKVGRTSTKIIVSDELKTLDGIDTTRTITEQFDAKVDTSFLESATTNFVPKIGGSFSGAIKIPTATAGTADSTAASTAFTASEIYGKDDKWVEDFNAIGLNIKLLPIASQTLFTASTALVDGTHYQVLFRVKKTTTITGVRFNQGSASGDYTADNYNGFGLYSTDGTTNTKITETANDGNLWKGTASTTNSKAFPSPVVLSPGLYYFTFVWNASATTAAPSISSIGTSINTQSQIFNGYKLTMQRTAQATLPATETISTTTSGTVVWGLMPY